MQGWAFFRVENESVLKDAVHEALVGAKIEPLPYNHPASGVGLVFFDAVSTELCNFLREVTNQGAERVLAIGASRACFGNVDCWQLLKAGASDVLAWDQSQCPGTEVAARLRRWDAVDTLMHSPIVQ